MKGFVRAVQKSALYMPWHTQNATTDECFQFGDSGRLSSEEKTKQEKQKKKKNLEGLFESCAGFSSFNEGIEK